MLGDVRERLLHDPVERRLDLGWQALFAEGGAEVDLHPALLAEGRRQVLDGRHEAEVVERARPQLEREAADVLQRRDDELPQAGGGLARLLGLERVLERPQAEEDGRERLPRLVVELARESPALELERV